MHVVMNPKSIRAKDMRRYMLIISIVLLAGCNTRTTSVDAQMTNPSVTLSTAHTEIVTDETPEFESLPFSHDILFASPSNVDCKLPCWQNLEIGKSNRSAIQQ